MQGETVTVQEDETTGEQEVEATTVQDGETVAQEEKQNTVSFEVVHFPIGSSFEDAKNRLPR